MNMAKMAHQEGASSFRLPSTFPLTPILSAGIQLSKAVSQVKK